MTDEQLDALERLAGDLYTGRAKMIASPPDASPEPFRYLADLRTQMNAQLDAETVLSLIADVRRLRSYTKVLMGPEPALYGLIDSDVVISAFVKIGRRLERLKIATESALPSNR